MSLSIAVDGNGIQLVMMLEVNWWLRMKSHPMQGTRALVARSSNEYSSTTQTRANEAAVVENNAGKALPCASNPERYDETEHFVSGAFSGDVRCALALGETDSGTPGNKRRRPYDTIVNEN